MPKGKKGKAELYRMVTPNHICPWGLKTLDLLQREGFDVEDHPLRSRQETDAFKQQYEVDTTPQTFIGSRLIGGYDDVRAFLGKHVGDKSAITYKPVIALFGMALAMALATGWAARASAPPFRAAEWFVAFAMCLLALQKLRDVDGFATMFLNYDLIAQRWVRYAIIYPFAEGAAGVLMIAGTLTWISAPVALFIGGAGALSVFKAVYIDKRALKCACVGGDSTVPLGFVSLTENLMMVAIAIWMLVK